MKNKSLWFSLIAVMVISFGIIGYYGNEIFKQMPPIPEKVVSEDGSILFTKQQILDGQNVWQSIGGQELGTVWGHGSYVAPDWSADWLHRESVIMLDLLSQKEFNNTYNNINAEKKALIKEKLREEIRKNTFDKSIGIIKISNLRAEAIKQNCKYYKGLFMDDPSLQKTRVAYSIPKNSVKTEERMQMMNSFFFWTSWACVTNRPDKSISYTNNWPAEELVANKPSGNLLLWSIFSFIVLLLGIGLLAYNHAISKQGHIDKHLLPENDPLSGAHYTPSMRATLKYFWVVTGLILFQVLFGAITAHYGVEGGGFYGLKLDTILPYSVSRTWHVQLAIFWIATSWFATGLYIAPAISGYEPKFQRFGVNFLFLALLIIVVGSLAGQWMGVMQKLGFINNFWFGHQGYEYVDLGRFWQIFLLVGLFLWLFLMVRALIPAFKKKAESNQLLALFVISAIAIAVLYGAGLMWGRQTHLSIVEYWRWWVVHLWVEGFFEVFATVVAAFLFVRMGLLNIKYATSNVLFATVIFLSGGIIGTFHHLYFTGTPTGVMALGATFSALEVVPLVLMGFEVYNNQRLSRATEWMKTYKWPVFCLISVSFWNLVGAGILGFLINPPIALYYMQGLNTTPVHGHAALFGVYGMLGIGLMLFVLRGLTGTSLWKEGTLKFAFWSINIGLMLMIVLSLLPMGLFQTVASVNHGMWYARSAEFMQDPMLVKIRWMRVIGDTIFAFGALALTWFVIGLKTGWSLKK
ncbi:MAG: nitric-oxide reductase large subunit [Bacteroidota bacterium]|nr:nitric-oxide reductase large subunit [Bacteroidota bacterium]